MKVQEDNNNLDWTKFREPDDDDWDEPFLKKGKKQYSDYPEGYRITMATKDLMSVYTQLGKWTDRYNKLMALGGQVNIIMNKKTVTRKSQGDLLQSL